MDILRRKTYGLCIPSRSVVLFNKSLDPRKRPKREFPGGVFKWREDLHRVVTRNMRTSFRTIKFLSDGGGDNAPAISFRILI
jgi:hypothetical protein